MTFFQPSCTCLRILAVLLPLFLLVAAPSLVPAQAEQSSPAPDEFGRDNPRSSMTGFISATRGRDFERGAKYLNLETLDPSTAHVGGAELARRLKIVLDQGLWVDLDGLSDEPAGNTEDGSESRDAVGLVELRNESFEVFLQREEVDGRPWQVASVSVARASAAYEELGLRHIEQFLPAFLFDIRIFEIFLWQWIAIAVLGVLAWIGAWAFAFVSARVVLPIVARTRTGLNELLDVALPPLQLVLGILVTSIGLRSLELAIPVMALASHVLRAGALVAIVWFLSRFTDLVARIIERRLQRRGDIGGSQLVTPGKLTIKIVIGLFAFVALLDNFGFDVATLIAGLGVGGIAVALAAQKTMENLFGGVALFADQPVRVGDYCRYGDKVGTVEEIGLRSTRVRSLDRTIVTIPNAEFSTLQLENFAHRDRIRLTTIIGLLYETTPDQLRYVLVEVRRMLYSHPKVLPTPARVRFVEFASSSLNIEVFAYVETSDWSEFLGVREDVFIRIMDIVNASGSSFAFPSQTLYLGRDAGVDRKKAERVENDVQQWRDRQEMYIPEFPPETIDGLKDAIQYPPEGSPERG